MKLDIFLRFSTVPGQTLFMAGNLAAVGNGDHTKALQMHYFNQEYWHVQLLIDRKEHGLREGFRYGFLLKDTDGSMLADWDVQRYLDLSLLPVETVLIESWNEMGARETIFETAPFRKVFLKREGATASMPRLKKKFRFSVKAFSLLPDEFLAVTGNTVDLGSWLSSGSVPMLFDGESWFTDIDGDKLPQGTMYKYVVVDSNGAFIRYEEGENRKLDLPHNPDTCILVQDGYIRLNNQNWRAAGLAVPVFSLRTKKSLGTGDFNDLLKLVDWAKIVSLKMIQLLPVNDTTCTNTYIDAYPYAAVSAFALHPLYASLEAIAGKKYRSLIADFLIKGKKLNSGSSLDYPAVMKLKQKALTFLYEQMGQETVELNSFGLFFKENQAWLKPYAVYNFLRDKYKTADWSQWGKHSQFNQSVIDEMTKKSFRSYHKVAVHYFVQYHLHMQLKKAHAYANKNGIILKGDLAIGVHRFGADTWTNPTLFHLNMQAGAPPDDFAVKGQNWGFPTYHWKNMKQDGYAWWRQRFKHMSSYVDALRVDHVLGFFRIWSIPDDAIEGIMGRFVPAIPITKQAFKEKGIDLQDERYCQPFITDEVLWQVAEQKAELLLPFLVSSKPGCYSFKSVFSSQRSIQQYFNGIKDTDTNRWLKQALFDLHSNVLLWKDNQQNDAYHFRFNAMETLSFHHLGRTSQHLFSELYYHYFYQLQEVLWKREALEKLSRFRRFSNVLICGEDLGFLPASVPDVLSRTGILSMEVQRMRKSSGMIFSDPASAPYLSVVTPSTHDMSTLRQWWLENSDQSQLFYNEMLWQQGDAPKEAGIHIISKIVQQHLCSPAMWAVFQLQDLFALDEKTRRIDHETERINLPSDPLHYWRYRMHIPVEDLLKNNTFNAEINHLISSSGRSCLQ